MKTKSPSRRFKKTSRVHVSATYQRFAQTKQARIGFVALTLVFGLLYVLQMNLTATKGYEIRDLEQQKTALQKENRRLELEAMELQSVDRLMAQLSDIRLVEAQPDRYIHTNDTTVASR